MLDPFFRNGIKPASYDVVIRSIELRLFERSCPDSSNLRMSRFESIKPVVAN